MKLIPDNSPQEVRDATALAEGLRRTMDATVVGTVPLNPDQPHQQVPADRIGLPAEVTQRESEAAELARLKQEQHAAEVESARLQGELAGMRRAEAERR